jgi:hypothetical protein
MTALILITNQAATIVILPDMTTCLQAARLVAHLGLVFCGGVGVLS